MTTLDVECPKCGAKAGDRCRALTSNRVTDTHTARMDALMGVLKAGIA